MHTTAAPCSLLALLSLFLCAGAQPGGGGESLTVQVSAQCNPFLAGQPPGTVCKQDSAPAQSPLRIDLQPLPNSLVRVTDVTGLTNYWPKPVQYGPEGGFLQYSEPDLGISGYAMPICALLGVFLPDTTNSGAAPPDLDFSSPSSRNYSVLHPQLFQTFFIGDGLRDDGITVQSVVVPQGATRLFLGICDGFGWNDNVGEFQCTVEQVEYSCTVSVYCTAKVNSQGCLPRIGFSGTPSLSGPDDFFVTAADVLNCRPGLMIWGRSPQALPFLGGTLCIASPIFRTKVQDSCGNASGQDCSGSYSFHLSQDFMAACGWPLGETVYAQYWSRDPLSAPYPAGLTDALSFSVCP